MKVELSGTRDGRPWPKRGETLELPDEEAAHYCAVGLAEPVAEVAEPQTAVIPDPEIARVPQPDTAVRPAPEKRKPATSKPNGKQAG